MSSFVRLLSSHVAAAEAQVTVATAQVDVAVATPGAVSDAEITPGQTATTLPDSLFGELQPDLKPLELSVAASMDVGARPVPLTAEATALVNTPMRGLIFVQHSAEAHRKMEAETHPDAIVMDVEDSVPLAQKATARAFIVQQCAQYFRRQCVDEHNKHVVSASHVTPPVVTVRVNSLDLLEETKQDIAQLALPGVHAFLLPKIGSASDVRAYEKLVADAEKANGLAPNSISFIPMLETAGGVVNAASILVASPRIAACIYGVADLAASMAINETVAVRESGRAMVALACHNAGVTALCGADITRVDEKIRFAQSCQYVMCSRSPCWVH